MKNILLLFTLLIAISGFSQQVYNVQVKPGDAIRIRKNNTSVITLPTAGTTDSNYQFTLVVQKKRTQVVNKPPVASAGNGQTIILPANSVTLSGAASDADGTISSVIWANATSSLQANIVSPSSLVTTITDLVQGSYMFRLTVTDNSGATATSTVNVTVGGLAPPPDTSGIKYEGFGANAIGGSNSTNTYHVTNLSSSGSGSLANGIGSNKTIVFDVNGTIYTRLDLISISYLTIDGSGHNITIDNQNNGDAISFDGANTHHCIVKFISTTNAGGDGINAVGGAHDILITNCNSYGNRDGNIDIAADNAGQTKNITVQYCILGYDQGPGNMLVTAQNVSVHHNLFIGIGSGEETERNPFCHSNYSPVGSPNVDFRNNLLYTFGRYSSGIGYKATGNFVNNYYAGSTVGVDPNADPAGNTASYYAAGNVASGSSLGGGNHAEYAIPAQYQITMQDAKAAGIRILQKVGTGFSTSTEQSDIAKIKIQ